jgi:MFS family permease
LVVVAGVDVLLSAGLIVGGGQGWTSIALAAIGLGLGMSVPATSAVVRGLYPRAIRARPELDGTVFALDSALTDATYVAGPALVSLAVAFSSAAVAIGVAAAAALGAVAALLSIEAEPTRPHRRRRTTSVGPVYTSAVKVLVLASFPVGLGFGIQEVAFPAFATAHDDPALSGLILALISVASVAGGLTYGVLSYRVAAASVLILGAAFYPVAFVLPAFATAALTMCLLATPVGLVNGPWIAARNHFMNVTTADELRASANGWALMCVYLGAAAGLSVGGVVVAAAGWRAALIAAGVGAGAIPLVTLLSRSALRRSSDEARTSGVSR